MNLINFKSIQLISWCGIIAKKFALQTAVHRPLHLQRRLSSRKVAINYQSTISNFLLSKIQEMRLVVMWLQQDGAICLLI